MIRRWLKTILIIMIAMGMTVTLNVDALFAEDGENVITGTSGKFSYKLYEDETIGITGYSGTASTLIIPKTIKSCLVVNIENQAFASQATVKTITIPESVVVIGESAFASSKLTTINYRGSESQWESVNKKDDSSAFKNVTVNYNCIEQISNTKLTLYKSRTSTLKVLYPNDTKTIKWSSSNKKIAKVSTKGKVTALKGGSATIKAKIGSRTYKCKVTVKDHVKIKIPTYSQHKNGYPRGCEGVSLYMCLKGKGYMSGISLKSFMSTMPKGKTPKEGFVGDPTKTKANGNKRTTIYPKPLAKWGSQYGTVVSLEGASVTTLKKELEKGNPVVVYVTSGWKTPVWKKYSWGKDVVNNHAVCLVGYTRYGNFIINDCGKKLGVYTVKKNKFTKIYNARKKAVAVR